jgi:hypothetical protein
VDPNKEVDILVRLGGVEQRILSAMESMAKGNSDCTSQLSDLDKRLTSLEQFRTGVVAWGTVAGAIWMILWKVGEWYLMHLVKP